MENPEDYISAFMAMPMAVILLLFMFAVLKMLTMLITKLIDLLEIQAKIIKQQERKE